MPPISDPSRPDNQASCGARDKRVARAIDSVERDSFQPLDTAWRELVDDALVRIVEDLNVASDARVLVVEPYSGYLPVTLSKLAREITVVCSHPARATVLAQQLAAAEASNVRMSPFVQDRESEDDALYDRIVVLQPPNEELGPVLQGLLAKRGRAIWSVDKNVPPRRVRRLLCVDEATSLEEDLDLVHYMPLLGDMLVEAGVVLRQEVAYAVHEAKEKGTRLGEELRRRGAISEDDLYRALADQRKMPFSKASDVLARLDVDLVRRLPRKYLDHFQFVPIRESDGQIHVVTPNIDLPVRELQSVFDDVDVVAELTTSTDMDRLWTAIELGFINRAAPSSVQQAVGVLAKGATPVDESAAEGLFEAILQDAATERASDIHLESYQDGSRLRFRVDGSLRDIGRYPMTSDTFVALVDLIKRAANLDASERRAPQGGNLFRRLGDESFELRVEVQPAHVHEGVVIRLVPQDRRVTTMEGLGFEVEVADYYRRLLKEPQGLILVTGATGAGKTTTLYAGAQELAKDTSRKVVTVEDPVELSLNGVQQTPVDRAFGFGFGEAIRSVVRQDPDAIMVDEIRDADTAREALRAARSGHLVVASLHAVDTGDAVQRLADFGVSPRALANELVAVFSQRLARRICTECRQPANVDTGLVAELFPGGAPEGFLCYEGMGCAHCDETGTHGRVAIVEQLRVGPEIKRAIRRGGENGDLRRAAHDSFMKSMRDTALAMVQNGTISMAELRDVLSTDQMRPVG